jgi:hypothetical protein
MNLIDESISHFKYGIDHDIYKNRQVVLDYLAQVGIESIGRFGRWEYFWTHQAFENGKEVA